MIVTIETGTPDATGATRTVAASLDFPLGEVLRDITRGGLAGAIAGVVAGGIGGRVVMRLAAIVHPEVTGLLTENGNAIGDMTLGGTLFLLFFGLLFGLMAGGLWVIASPWIPGRTTTRAFLTAGVAILIGTPLVIIGGNPDFVILNHDAMVVGLLVALVGLIGLSIAFVDDWLERRLPHTARGERGPTVVYSIVTLLGLVLVLPFLLLIFLTSDEYDLPLRAGLALLLVGACTATWWGLRIRGRMSPPRSLIVAARGALFVAMVLGFLTTLPHVSRALGAPY